MFCGYISNSKLHSKTFGLHSLHLLLLIEICVYHLEKSDLCLYSRDIQWAGVCCGLILLQQLSWLLKTYVPKWVWSSRCSTLKAINGVCRFQHSNPQHRIDIAHHSVFRVFPKEEIASTRLQSPSFQCLHVGPFYQWYHYHHIKIILDPCVIYLIAINNYYWNKKSHQIQKKDEYFIFRSNYVQKLQKTSSNSLLYNVRLLLLLRHHYISQLLSTIISRNKVTGKLNCDPNTPYTTLLS
jgi:hypothetical protein